MNLIINPFAPTPVNLKSHVRGWAMHWAECLGCQIALKESDFRHADTLYWDHGVNFGGGLNLFGGVTDDIVRRLQNVVDFQGELISLDIPMPNYAEQLRKRIGQATCSPHLTGSLIDAFEAKLAQSRYLTQVALQKPVVTIGDSHSTAFADKGSAVLRTNGQTLYGALKKGLIQQQIDALGYEPERVTLVYGSIDIRHHIGRQVDPDQAAISLAKSYAAAARQIQGDYLCKVEVAASVPVEHEGRRIPQTGFYEGSPFSGSREDRLRWTQAFKTVLCDAGLNVAQPPEDWYTMDGKMYASTYMELSSSVHIAPMFYRRFDWGKMED